MTRDTQFSCRCGALRGRAVGLTRRTASRVVCHCADCVRASRHFGVDASAEDGVDLVQTTPDLVAIDAGSEHLGLARLSPRGVLRWYATCCGTPMFNTASKPGFSFVAILTDTLADTEAVGPVIARVNRVAPGGKVQNAGLGRMVVGLLRRALSARMSGRWRQTPFFDPDSGKPVVEAEVLPKDAGRA